MFFAYQQKPNLEYVLNEQVKKLVIIEAENAIEADSIALSKGLYFKKYSGSDCECGSCPYRWSSHAHDLYNNQHAEDLVNKLPFFYAPIEDLDLDVYESNAIIYFADGGIQYTDSFMIEEI